MAGRVTLADVSKRAGVGIATVSRALAPQDHPDVSTETRARIRLVADELGYRPSVTARALRNHDYRAVSIMVPEETWGWFDSAVRGASAAADEHGYRTLVQPYANPGQYSPGNDAPRAETPARPSTAASLVSSLVEVPAEGLLIFGSAYDADVVEEARRLRLPFVAIDDVAHEVLVPTVVTDSRAGARIGVEHLLSLGRRKIAYVGSDYDAYYVRERQLGYRAALADAGISFDPDLMVTCPDTNDESLRVHPNFDGFLASQPGIDAIFCEADQIAAAVLRSLRVVGLSVPQDISVVGFDDERAALLVDPPLTSVRQPYEELGRRALDILLKAIRGESVPVGRELVPPRLVVRQSTASVT